MPEMFKLCIITYFILLSQQKLVLRNNSTNTTQQLRLLIRGQDQDCFQVDHFKSEHV